MFFIPLFLISFTWFPTARGELKVVCSSGMTVLNNQNASTALVTGRLPSDTNQRRSCVLKMDKPDSFLHMRAKRNDNFVGFLHIFLYEADGSSLLGHVDVSKPAPFWNTLTIYPPGLDQTFTIGEKYMSIYGTSGVSFTVEVTQSSSEIVLNTPKTVKVDSADVMVFQFNPPKGISKRQLDITATSLSNVPAYLKISQIRRDVEENIKCVDYKKKSLRLSFAKKGRITLSKVSVPPLTDSTTSWYVGIAVKDKPSESKYVTLELSQSFDYSYAGPICALFFVSLGVGVVVSFCALWCFKESLAIDTLNVTVIVNKGAEPQDANPTGDQDRNNHDAQNATVIGKGAEPQDSNPTGDQDRNNHDAQKCMQCRKVVRIILAMPEVAYNYWFADGPKTYSYATGIVGFVLMIGAGQFVIANWYIMIQEGDRDNCYYNDFCYRVSDHDIPFNLMISNLTYIIHSLILTVCVWYMEAELFLYCKNLENLLAQGQSESRSKNESQSVSDSKNENKTEGQSQSQSQWELENESESERQNQKQSQRKGARERESERENQSQNQQSQDQEFLFREKVFPELRASVQKRAKNQKSQTQQSQNQQSQNQQSQNQQSQNQQSQTQQRQTQQSQNQQSQSQQSQTQQSQNQVFSFPDHVMVCPNITPHFLEGAFPSHEFTVEERKELRARAWKKKYSFSIGYAFAWALLFEGLFSTLYHLCPSRFTFQFDSAFMFVIAGLTVLLLYNGIEVNECPSSEKVKYPVGALNFFLYFIVPLFIFNYFGSLYHSESGLSKTLQGFFFFFLIIWWFAVFFWAYKKLKIRKGVFTSCCNWCYFISGGFLAPPLLFSMYLLSDLSQAFLLTCIIVSIAAVCAKTEVVQKICKYLYACIGSCECGCPAITKKEFCQGCYIFVTFGVLIGAVCIFQLLPTTDKTSSPEESGDLNKECGILGFFDWHDLWHFLSSFALLMGAFVIMFISAEQVQSNGNSRRECADIVKLNEVEINANESPGGDDKNGGNEMDGGNKSHYDNDSDGGNGRGGEK